MTEDLLRLLELAHPGRSQADLLAMIEATPNAATKAPGKPAQRRVGSRPRTTASMERRRSWAASGRMPPKLAARFTLAEQAVLAVIAVEMIKKDACTLAVGHIAALAGVSETTVRNALRQAQALGLLAVEERRVSAWRNNTNVITITSPEWASWLRLRPHRGGCKSANPTTLRSTPEDRSSSMPNAQQRFSAGSGGGLSSRKRGYERAGKGTNRL